MVKAEAKTAKAEAKEARAETKTAKAEAKVAKDVLSSLLGSGLLSSSTKVAEHRSFRACWEVGF